MIIWRGAGVLVFVIAFGCSLVAQLMCNKIAGTEAFWETHAWPLAAALAAAAGIVWLVGSKLEARPGRELVDPATGQRVQLKKPHEFFFIKMKYWGAILLAIGITILVTNTTPGPSRAHAANDRSAAHQTR
jgi:hypothetical protein